MTHTEVPDSHFLEMHGLVRVDRQVIAQQDAVMRSYETAAQQLQEFFADAGAFYGVPAEAVLQVRFMPTVRPKHFMPLPTFAPGVTPQLVTDLAGDLGTLPPAHPFLQRMRNHVGSPTYAYEKFEYTPSRAGVSVDGAVDLLGVAFRELAGYEFFAHPDGGYVAERGRIPELYYYTFIPMESPVMDTL